jgi:hypothetical protein
MTGDREPLSRSLKPVTGAGTALFLSDGGTSNLPAMRDCGPARSLPFLRQGSSPFGGNRNGFRKRRAAARVEPGRRRRPDFTLPHVTKDAETRATSGRRRIRPAALVLALALDGAHLPPGLTRFSLKRRLAGHLFLGEASDASLAFDCRVCFFNRGGHGRRPSARCSEGDRRKQA